MSCFKAKSVYNESSELLGKGNVLNLTKDAKQNSKLLWKSMEKLLGKEKSIRMQ